MNMCICKVKKDIKILNHEIKCRLTNGSNQPHAMEENLGWINSSMNKMQKCMVPDNSRYNSTQNNIN